MKKYAILIAVALLLPSPYAAISQAIRRAAPILPKKMKEGICDELVLETKIIKINGAEFPYNASIIENGEGYSLYFRHDNDEGSLIGLAYLDRDFYHQDPEPTWIETGSKTAEDPRAFKAGGNEYIVYNDQIDVDFECRRMHITDETSIICLDEHIGLNEKNWTPFEYEGDIHFVYSINPHKILKYADEKVEHLTSSTDPLVYNLEWHKKYGEPRGGTPARLVNGEYLSFFHSMWTHKKTGIRWYAMGAYTFEASPPFRITSMSKKPIMFKEAYSTKPQNTAPKDAKILYPSGFVVDGEKIHVSCGENDCATRIVTFDKQSLLQNLERLDNHHS